MRSWMCGLLFALTLMAGGRASFAETPADALLHSLKPTADVNDFAKRLSAADREALEQRCRQLREKSGAQFAVVILNSLQGGQIDDFTNKLFKQWGVGQKDKNNGLMLLVAIQDCKARLEVGYGLEPILPDALAGRILNEQLFPAFKQQRYGDGLKAALNRACEIVERGQPATWADRQANNSDVPLSVLILFLGLFVAVGAFLTGIGIGARVLVLPFFGFFFVGVGIFMGCIGAFPIAPIVHGVEAVIVGWLGWLVGRASPKTFRPSGTGRRGRSYAPDTWVWGVSSGSSGGASWSSGGFSGDSGGFGGGCSGGGGASGGW